MSTGEFKYIPYENIKKNSQLWLFFFIYNIEYNYIL